MQIAAPAIVCASRAHGETGAVVRLLTAEHGLIAAMAVDSETNEPLMLAYMNAESLRRTRDLVEPLPAWVLERHDFVDFCDHGRGTGCGRLRRDFGVG